MSSNPARRMRRAASSPEPSPMRQNGHVLLPHPPEIQAVLQQVALQAAQQAARTNDTQLVAQMAAVLHAAGGRTYLEAVEGAVELTARAFLAMQPDAAGGNALSRVVDRLRAGG